MVIFLACAPADPPLAVVAKAEDPPALAPAELLTRFSLDLRGVRPSIAEQVEVEGGESAEASYAAVDGLAASWLADPRFGAQVGRLYDDVLLSRLDAYTVTAEDFGQGEEAPFIQSIGEVPARVIARVADEDLPWTDLVTADWTMADETLAPVWPVAWPEGATGWQVVRWTDARPAVGLLAATSLWWRYTTTDSNANRGRANAISRIFLCNDYLQHPITFDRDVSLVDEASVRAALTTSPECVACHVSLDPVAANLYGFLYHFDSSPYDRVRYHPEREAGWEEAIGVEPGYFGVPSVGLADLGPLLAADRRYPRCAVETIYGGLLGRPLGLDDEGAVVAHREAFLRGGVTARALYASILTDPVYRGAVSDGDNRPTRKMVPPALLASAVEELTGYRLTRSDWDLLRSDLYGYRLLAGGIDGVNATRAPDVPTPTLLLVQERIAEAAAGYALSEGTPGLFEGVDPQVVPGDTERAAGIETLALRVLGSRLDTEELELLAVLWDEAYAATSEPGEAWRAVLTALLRDPALVMY